MVTSRRKPTDADRVEELEQMAVDIWHQAQQCDGSRADQQAALDSIQESIETEIPDVNDREPSEQESTDDESEDEG